MATKGSCSRRGADGPTGKKAGSGTDHDSRRDRVHVAGIATDELFEIRIG